MNRRALLVLLSTATALAWIGPPGGCLPAEPPGFDEDGDGYAEDVDCAPLDPAIHPGADEGCDGIDTDCDGALGPGEVDGDGDGFTPCDGDCDDGDAGLGPHAIEIPLDGVDQSCDGLDVCVDLNCDGWPDLVFSNKRIGNGYNIDSFVYWGSAAGFSEEDRTGLLTHAAAGNSIADLDGDGYLDIVFSNATDGFHEEIDSYIYWGGAEGYSEEFRTGLPTALATYNTAADLDGDGWLDLVFSNSADDSGNVDVDSTVFWGSAEGFDEADATHLPTLGTGGVSAADLDGDSWLDLVFSNAYDGSSYAITSFVYWGGAAGFDPADRTELPTWGAQGNAAADVDQDGRLDLVFGTNAMWDLSHTGEEKAYLYWGRPAGFSVDARDEIESSATGDVTLHDVDGDGWLDLLISNYAAPDYVSYLTDSFLYWGGPMGYSAAERVELPTSGASGHAIADLDLDGYLDLVFACHSNGTNVDIHSFLYWGGPEGFDEAARTELRTDGAGGASVAGPGVEVPRSVVY